MKLMKLAKPVVESFPGIAAAYRNIRDSWPITEQPRNTPMNFKFMGNEAMQAGVFEPAETKVFARLLSHVDVIINIGANVGYYCCLAMYHKKYVVAFEPVTRNLQYLLRNVRANDWGDQIEVYPVALGDRGFGMVEIYGGGTGASLLKGWAGIPEHYVTLVPCSTLDNMIGSRFCGRSSLILVDIEGAENLMLKGASTALEMTPKPIWMVEVSVTEHQPAGVHVNPNLLSTFQVFWRAGYEARTADEQGRLVHADEIETIARTGIDTLHTHNFLFIESGRADELLGPGTRALA